MHQFQLDPFMHKRKGFECEREVRILSYNQKHCIEQAWALMGGNGCTPAPDPPPELPEHLFLDWNPINVVNTIVISPYATEDYEQRVRDAVASIHLSVVRLVELSVLSERRYGANF